MPDWTLELRVDHAYLISLKTHTAYGDLDDDPFPMLYRGLSMVWLGLSLKWGYIPSAPFSRSTSNDGAIITAKLLLTIGWGESVYARTCTHAFLHL